MDNPELQKILEAGNAEACLAFFKGMPETERRKLASQCQAWHRKINKEQFVQVKPGTFRTNALLPAANLAVFAVATRGEVLKSPDFRYPHQDSILEILHDRRPDWMADFAMSLLEGKGYYWRWPVVRRMVVEGLISKPDHPHYALGMINGMVQWHDGEGDLEEMLRANPDLIEECWKLFEYEGETENSLANFDQYSRGRKTWSEAFRAVLEPRQRLLDASLSALQLNFNHYRSRWFSTFYDQLEPTAEERKAHAEAYLQILQSSVPNVVSWAYKKVEGEASHYEPDVLVDGLQPVLLQRQKGIVKKALKLLGKIQKKHPDQAENIARVALTALAHEAAEVQEAALALIEKVPAEEVSGLATEVQAYAELIAPSLRTRLQQWMTLADADPEKAAPSLEEPVEWEDLDPELANWFSIPQLLENQEKGTLCVPAATFDGTELPRLAVHEPIEPVQDLDELIQLCAAVMEGAAWQEDVERAYDGLSRLCDERPDDFEARISPIAKRARNLLRKDRCPFKGNGPFFDMPALVHAWATGETARLRQEKDKRSNNTQVYLVVEIAGATHRLFDSEMESVNSVLGRRAFALSQRIAKREASPLLSLPTHTGNWIGPMVLAGRVKAWSGPPPHRIDVMIALLRLAPEYRAEALKLLGKHRGKDEWIQAVRYALGDRKVEVGKDAALWISAARARAPWESHPEITAKFPTAGPDAGEPAEYQVDWINLRVESGAGRDDLAEDCIPVIAHCIYGKYAWERGGFGAFSGMGVREAASVWPLARESYFANAAMEIGGNLDWWEAAWQTKFTLEPLLDPGTPLREMGLLLLGLGLAAKEPGEHGLATDIAIACIEDGRLGSDNLGDVLASLVWKTEVKPGRLAKQLGEVSRISSSHAAVVKLALHQCLEKPEGGAELPRDFAKLLELLKELSFELEYGVADQKHRDLLAGFRGKNKTAQEAGKLLEIPYDSVSGKVREALNGIAHYRVAAVRRFQRE